jgi:hypothetical protein
MKKLTLNLQLFADINSVFEQNAELLKEVDKDGFTKLTSKLGELGYDILVNERKSAEFIPSSRLNEVVSQREQFKAQVTTLSEQLEALKANAKGSPELQAEYDKMLQANGKLMADLEAATVNSSVIVAAREAHNPQDILQFVDKTKIKKKADGSFAGIEEEVARIKAEKPYLFSATQRKGGHDTSGGGTGNEQMSMNNFIRRAAGSGHI